MYIHQFYITADFERTLTPVYEVNGNTTEYQHHKPRRYGLKVNCIHDKFSKPKK